MTRKTYSTLKAGDVVLDCMGTPMLRVESNAPARAAGYRVIFGIALKNIDGQKRLGDRVQISGWKGNDVAVQ